MSNAQKTTISRREARKAELLDTWTSGKKGQMTILSKFYKSVIDLLVEKEFGPLPVEEQSPQPASEASGDELSGTGVAAPAEVLGSTQDESEI
jgi:hypothetical protein